jgi:hypothetical protein
VPVCTVLPLHGHSMKWYNENVKAWPERSLLGPALSGAPYVESGAACGSALRVLSVDKSANGLQVRLSRLVCQAGGEGTEHTKRAGEKTDTKHAENGRAQIGKQAG